MPVGSLKFWKHLNWLRDKEPRVSWSWLVGWPLGAFPGVSSLSHLCWSEGIRKKVPRWSLWYSQLKNVINDFPVPIFNGVSPSFAKNKQTTRKKQAFKLSLGWPQKYQSHFLPFLYPYINLFFTLKPPHILIWLVIFVQFQSSCLGWY